MLKDLVYLCVFYDKRFIDMLSLFLESYVLYGNERNNIDLMILTNREFKCLIMELGEKYNINIIVRVLESKSVFDSKIARLRIFDLDISDYRNILYLDTDILLSGNLNLVLKADLELEDKLYVVRESDIGNNYHGKFLFESNGKVFDYKRYAFNSGVLLFKNCVTIKRLFEQIMMTIIEYNNQDKSRFVSQVDQPFFNYYTIIRGLDEMTYLDGLSINNPNGKDKHVICHFAGNDGNKYENMKRFLDNMKNEMII